MVKIAPYGSWSSPISAADAASTDGGPVWTALHDGQVWWAETRPDEGGRVALLRHTADGPQEVLTGGWNARNRVHEYGGKPWVVLPDGQVAFTHWDDQRIHLTEPGGQPRPITPVPDREHGLRYADLAAGPGGVWCVRETMTGDRPTDVARHLVRVSPDGVVTELAASHHFMSGPRVSPDGRHAAWFGWNHPDMPWDGSELCVAEVRADGTLAEHRVLAGGPGVSVCQVDWDDRGLLALIDPDGWWNLHRVGLDGSVVNLARCDREIGGPNWKLGLSWFAPLGGGRHAVLAGGALAVVDERTGTVTDVQVDLPSWSPTLAAADGVVIGIAAAPEHPDAVVRLDLSTGELTALTARSPRLPDPAYLPQPVQRSFPGPDGRQIPAHVFAPRNPEHAGPEGELPPYVVHVHGGPTGHAGADLDLTTAYFTSRGIGVVAVNHGGSYGYGREFRDVLREQWGVVDVLDCAAVAAALAAEGTADRDRLGIRGGSAGGWTAAASITTPLADARIYRCATILYPVLDLTTWTGGGGETHDFESRYVEGLVGRMPEHADRYRERSPMMHVADIAGPVLLLQGLEDEVCPPAQADRFVASLDGSGTPHAYLTFAGEQHGFRRADTITTALQAELSFYGQVFGFDPPDVPVLELRG